MAASMTTEPRGLHRVPVETITADARQARPGRALAALIGAVFIAIGWVAGKAAIVIFMAVSYTLSSAKYGWRSARGTLNRPTYEQLYARVEALTAENARLGGTG
jgi:hypothetical protein